MSMTEQKALYEDWMERLYVEHTGYRRGSAEVRVLCAPPRPFFRIICAHTEQRDSAPLPQHE